MRQAVISRFKSDVSIEPKLESVTAYHIGFIIKLL